MPISLIEAACFRGGRSGVLLDFLRPQAATALCPVATSMAVGAEAAATTVTALANAYATAIAKLPSADAAGLLSFAGPKVRLDSLRSKVTKEKAFLARAQATSAMPAPGFSDKTSLSYRKTAHVLCAALRVST